MAQPKLSPAAIQDLYGRVFHDRFFLYDVAFAIVPGGVMLHWEAERGTVEILYNESRQTDSGEVWTLASDMYWLYTNDPSWTVVEWEYFSAWAKPAPEEVAIRAQLSADAFAPLLWWYTAIYWRGHARLLPWNPPWIVGGASGAQLVLTCPCHPGRLAGYASPVRPGWWSVVSGLHAHWAGTYAYEQGVWRRWQLPT